MPNGVGKVPEGDVLQSTMGEEPLDQTGLSVADSESEEEKGA